MRISDWSSDVCSSDLLGHALANRLDERHAILEPLAYRGHDNEPVEDCHTCKADEADRRGHREVDPGEREGEYPASKAERHGKEHRGRAPKGTNSHVEQDRKSGVEGQSVSGSVALGGRRNNKKKK